MPSSRRFLNVITYINKKAADSKDVGTKDKGGAKFW